MEFFVAGSNKLKITLTREECIEQGIDTTLSDFSTNEMKISIRRILNIAGQECGFFSEGERVFAQLYPMPDGGCEIFVTKLKGIPDKARTAVRDIEGFGSIEQCRGVYSFEDSSSLVAAARAIYQEGVDCDLYASDDGRYYISIEENYDRGISEFEVLIEYGERVKCLPVYVISERGTLLCKKKALDYIMSMNKPKK